MDEQSRRFYKDRFATTKNLLISERLSAYQRNPAAWSQWILDRFPLKPHESILEIGCGLGDFWSDVDDQLPSDLKIFLTDASPAMIYAASKKLPSLTDLNFIINDGESLSFKSASFHTVFANHVLHILPHLKTAFSEISRVLKPSGRLIFSIMSNDHLKELGAALAKLNSGFEYPTTDLLRFSSKSVTPFLSGGFKVLQNDIFENKLEVTDASLIVDTALTIFNGIKYPDLIPQKKAFKQIVLSEMEKRNGIFGLTVKNELYVCQRK